MGSVRSGPGKWAELAWAQGEWEEKPECQPWLEELAGRVRRASQGPRSKRGITLGGLLRREGLDGGVGDGSRAPEKMWWRMVQHVRGPSVHVMEVVQRLQRGGHEGEAQTKAEEPAEGAALHSLRESINGRLPGVWAGLTDMSE